MAKQARQVITVYGNLAFPTDMLRYDCAFPRTENDSRRIDASMFGTAGFQEIEVVSDDPNAPNRDRWYSFGWKVIKVDVLR